MNLQVLSADKQYDHGGSAYQRAITLNPRFCSTDSEDLGCWPACRAQPILPAPPSGRDKSSRMSYTWDHIERGLYGEPSERGRHQHRRRVHSVATTGTWRPGLVGAKTPNTDDSHPPPSPSGGLPVCTGPDFKKKNKNPTERLSSFFLDLALKVGSKCGSKQSSCDC